MDPRDIAISNTSAPGKRQSRCKIRNLSIVTCRDDFRVPISSFIYSLEKFSISTPIQQQNSGYATSNKTLEFKLELCKANLVIKVLEIYFSAFF